MAYRTVNHIPRTEWRKLTGKVPTHSMSLSGPAPIGEIKARRSRPVTKMIWPTSPTWLRECKSDEQGMSIATSNHYLRAVKSFGSWLVRERRWSENPFRYLSKAGGTQHIAHRAEGSSDLRSWLQVCPVPLTDQQQADIRRIIFKANTPSDSKQK